MSKEPRMRNLNTGTVHAVCNASGGSEDGSLHGFYLYCGPVIDLEQDYHKWEELDASEPATCKTCRASLHASHDFRLVRELITACWELICDSAARPGAYLHADKQKIYEIELLCKQLHNDDY